MNGPKPAYLPLVQVYEHPKLGVRSLGLFLPYLTQAFNAGAYVTNDLRQKYGSLDKVPDKTGVSFGPNNKWEWKWSFYRGLLRELDESLARGEFATVQPGGSQIAEPHPLAADIIRRLVVGPMPLEKRNDAELLGVDIDAELRGDLQEAYLYGTAPKGPANILSKLNYGTPAKYFVSDWRPVGANVASRSRLPSTPVVVGAVTLTALIIAAVVTAK